LIDRRRTRRMTWIISEPCGRGGVRYRSSRAARHRHRLTSPGACSPGSRSGLGRWREHSPRARCRRCVRDPIRSSGPRRREPLRPARVLGWVDRASTVHARAVLVAPGASSARRGCVRLAFWAGSIVRAPAERLVTASMVVVSPSRCARTPLRTVHRRRVVDRGLSHTAEPCPTSSGASSAGSRGGWVGRSSTVRARRSIVAGSRPGSAARVVVAFLLPTVRRAVARRSGAFEAARPR